MENKLRRIKSTVKFVPLLFRAWNAYHYAKQRQTMGLRFAEYGRRVGWRLLRNLEPLGMSYVLNPVHIVRYFEFPFALSALPATPKKCLDVSSPRLFSLLVAKEFPDTNITIINPDARDITESTKMVKTLGYKNIKTELADIQGIDVSEGQFDTIWSLSVIEHIEGAYNDSDVMKMLYDLLAPGGRIILTIPIDREYWIEYRGDDPYGLQTKQENNQYFYQRFYDLEQIEERLLKPIGRPALQLRWFGEKEPGHFQHYIKQSRIHNYRVKVDDPRIINDHYQEYKSFAEMPGVGVCGLVVEKP